MLAYFQNEPGCGQVTRLLERADAGECHLAMCIVNLGEVVYNLERRSGMRAAQNALARMNRMPVEVFDADRPLTLAAAKLKVRFSIAYADCFAVALAQAEKASVVTGDPEFRKVEGTVRIEWVEQRDS